MKKGKKTLGVLTGNFEEDLRTNVIKIIGLDNQKNNFSVPKS